MDKYLKTSDVLDLIDSEIKSLNDSINHLPLNDGQRFLFITLKQRLIHLKFKVLFPDNENLYSC